METEFSLCELSAQIQTCYSVFIQYCQKESVYLLKTYLGLMYLNCICIFVCSLSSFNIIKQMNVMHICQPYISSV